MLLEGVGKAQRESVEGRLTVLLIVLLDPRTQVFWRLSRTQGQCFPRRYPVQCINPPGTRIMHVGLASWPSARVSLVSARQAYGAAAIHETSESRNRCTKLFQAEPHMSERTKAPHSDRARILPFRENN